MVLQHNITSLLVAFTIGMLMPCTMGSSSSQGTEAVNDFSGLHWGYAMRDTDELPPALWGKLYPACAGKRQSPIAINSREPRQLDLLLRPLELLFYDQMPIAGNWTLIDNGHSVQISGQFGKRPPSLRIRRGNLRTTYVLTQLHFHWGRSDAMGSEHVIDGKRYPIEVHFVHRKETITDDEASKDPMGLAVVAVIFEKSSAGSREMPNPQMEALANAVRLIKTLNVPVTVRTPELRLSKLIPDDPAYFQYLGSLTTPPCAESVVWNVMKTPLKVTEQQLKAFRALVSRDSSTDREVADNYRPLQSLSGRAIHYHPKAFGSHDRRHNPMEALSNAVRQTKSPNFPVTIKIPNLCLSDLLADAPTYFRYLRLLTTPPCAESLVWSVRMKSVKVTEHQLYSKRQEKVEWKVRA
ncbi:putative Carbonic anhydrase 7 [Hypsibius exemplaris]|uniref:Carbonic anhydrase n=1 Tax=Hypsibius exemplaris TaxID=2072580 RepID=A0A1W0XBN3_HYPEX|nr:putative Carbonic anhydrase 7 [Hypsibius exemplaris]